MGSRAATNRSAAPISCDWKLEGDRLTLDVAMPVGTSATVYVPAKSADAVTEGGQPVGKADGVKLLGMEDGAAALEILSGHYAFQSVFR